MSKIQTIHTPGKLQNLIINGGLDFWQERVGTTTTVNTASASNPYIADMVRASTFGTTVKNFSVVRSSDVPSTGLSMYSALFTQITGIPTLAATDITQPFVYPMEGLDYSKIHNGVVTLGFWVKPSIAGTYSISLTNSSAQATRRSYITTFTAIANVWQFVSKTIKLDTTSNWDFDNSGSFYISIGSVSGTTYRTGTTDSWQTGVFYSANTSTNWTGTNGATLRVALLSLVQGSLGFTPTSFQRAGDTVQAELSMCQRYFEKSYNLDVQPGTGASFEVGIRNSGNAHQGSGTSTTSMNAQIPFLVSKRVSPSLVIYDHSNVAGVVSRINTNNTNNAGQVLSGVAASNNSFGLTSSSGAAATSLYFHYVADARM